MPISKPVDYIQNESGTIVKVTLVTGSMSLIGPDYFDLGELRPGDYVVDFPDGSVSVIDLEKLNTNYTEKPTKGYWSSIDDARSFAMEMQYALDHPEELYEGRQLTPKEIAEAKAHIRSAKEYLAANDESL